MRIGKCSILGCLFGSCSGTPTKISTFEGPKVLTFQPQSKVFLRGLLIVQDGPLIRFADSWAVVSFTCIAACIGVSLLANVGPICI